MYHSTRDAWTKRTQIRLMEQTSHRVRTRRGGRHLVAGTLLVALWGSLAAGQEVDYRVENTSQRLEMVVNSSRILSMDRDIPRLLVNNPDVVRAVPLSPTQVQVSAVAPGVTQVNLWDEQGVARSVDVIVFRDSRPLEMILASEFPKAAIRVRPTENSVVLSGYVDRPEIVSRVVAIASDYYPNVINNINVGGVQQVLLHVKVMEVSRTKLQALGTDWAFLFSDDYIINSSAGLINGVASTARNIVGTGQETVRVGIINDPNQFFAFIRALSDRQLVRILAEPTLVAVSGRPAAFNEGGEFPILVPAGFGNLGVEFKQFGTRVDFVPIVLGNGHIRLEVRPEVSEIDAARGVTLNGVTVPGLRSRFVDTAVEMRSGQTLALAGLIQRRTESKKRGLPWLMDIPWAGNFFRVVQEDTNEIELLVTVTPHLAAALDPEQVPPLGPGQATTSPCDADLLGRGHLEVPRCCPDVRCPQPGEAQGSYLHNPAGHVPTGPGYLPGPAGVVPGPDGTIPGPVGTVPGASEYVPGSTESVPIELVPPAGGNIPATPAFPAGTTGTSTVTDQNAYANPPGAPMGGTYSIDSAAEPAAAPADGSAPQLLGPFGYDDLD